MSRKVYRNYRVLSEEQKKILNGQYSKPEGIYSKENERTEGRLEFKAVGNSQDNEYIIDNTDFWDPETDSCSISQHLMFDPGFLQNLFSDDNGIAAKDSILGIAALWQIDKTSIRGCEKIESNISIERLRMSHHEFEVRYNQNFRAGILAGTLIIRFVLYLEASGLRSAFGRAKLAGTLLGDVISPLIIHIDGDAPAFPVVTVSSPERELWWIEYGSDICPETDPFSEDYVSLVLNKGHEDYSKLKNGDKYDTPLFKEVFASALEEIFRYFYQDQFATEMKNTDDFQEGSIAMALKYMKDNFSIETDSLESLHKTIRRMIQNPAGTGVVQ